VSSRDSDSSDGDVQQKPIPADESFADKEPIISLSNRSRWAVAVTLVGLAGVHLKWPDVAIDSTFLGLLAFAGLVLLFDVDRIEWLGVRAKRRALDAETAHVKTLPIPSTAVEPSPPTFAPVRLEAEPELEVAHKEPFDLMPPVGDSDRLFWATEQIRIELVIIAGNAGRLPDRRNFDDYRPAELATVLFQSSVIPRDLVDAINTVVEQRNLLAHGVFGPRAIARSASELGIEVLIKLRQVKRNYIRVAEPQVQLFRTPSLSGVHAASPGVQIEQIGFSGERLHLQVFPTRSNYVRGRYVTWEWDLAAGFDQEAWYLDKETKAAKLAFSSATVFQGREYPLQWGVQYRVPGPFRPHS
jgi:hypothetical protein